jgi:cytochrome bd-type quinol oxidase subunit 2
MSKTKDEPILITGNEARGGLHEHRAHYVLAFGLAGGIIAFLAVGLYFGYQKLTHTSLPSDPTWLISYAILIGLGAVGTAVLIGLWSMLSGGSPNMSQRVMRWRVVLQFIVLCFVMAVLYLSGKH